MGAGHISARRAGVRTPYPLAHSLSLIHHYHRDPRLAAASLLRDHVVRVVSAMTTPSPGPNPRDGASSLCQPRTRWRQVSVGQLTRRCHHHHHQDPLTIRSLLTAAYCLRAVESRLRISANSRMETVSSFESPLFPFSARLALRCSTSQHTRPSSTLRTVPRE